jgi:hypothetical protein
MSTVKSKKLQVGTDATSSNNFTIYQPATPDGTLRIGVGNAENPTEVGRFNANGYKPQQPVAFRAYSTVDQSISGNVDTKITFGAETFDTSNSFANSRFTAPVSGYYHFSGSTHMQGPNGQYHVSIFVNDDRKLYGNIGYSNGTNASPELSCILYISEGQYVDLYGKSSTNTTFYAGTSLTWFSGILIAQG